MESSNSHASDSKPIPFSATVQGPRGNPVLQALQLLRSIDAHGIDIRSFREVAEMIRPSPGYVITGPTVGEALEQLQHAGAFRIILRRNLIDGRVRQSIYAWWLLAGNPSGRNHSKEWRTWIRDGIRKRDAVEGWLRCWICLGWMPENDRWTIDHLTPLSLGGGNYLYNVAAAHHACNQERANAPLERPIPKGHTPPISNEYPSTEPQPTDT